MGCYCYRSLEGAKQFGRVGFPKHKVYQAPQARQLHCLHAPVHCSGTGPDKPRTGIAFPAGDRARRMFPEARTPQWCASVASVKACPAHCRGRGAPYIEETGKVPSRVQSPPCAACEVVIDKIQCEIFDTVSTHGIERLLEVQQICFKERNIICCIDMSAQPRVRVAVVVGDVRRARTTRPSARAAQKDSTHLWQ